MLKRVEAMNVAIEKGGGQREDCNLRIEEAHAEERRDRDARIETGWRVVKRAGNRSEGAAGSYDDVDLLEEDSGASSADEQITCLSSEACDHCYGQKKELFREVLKSLGEDVNREGILKTPARYAKAMAQMLSGYSKTADGVLGDAIFHEKCLYGKKQAVCVGNIEFFSTDAHTLLPFFGMVHICYLPAQGNVAGLSKFARIVEVFSKRLQTPQKLAGDIACNLQRLLAPLGVLVVVESMHLTSSTIGKLHHSGWTTSEDYTDAHLEAKGVFLNQNCEETQEMLALIDSTHHLNLDGTTKKEDGDLPMASESSSSFSGGVSKCFSSFLDDLLGGKRQYFREQEDQIKNLIYQIYDQSKHLDGPNNVSRDLLWSASNNYANWLLTKTSGSLFTMDYILQVVRSLPQMHDRPGGDCVEDGAFRKYRTNSLHCCELYTSVGSMCEHHILPFFGKIYISLLKDGSQVNVTREELEAILWKYSRQLQLQERLATQVADAIEKFFPFLDGIFVCMSAYHHCMRARGAEKTSAKTLSVIKRGIYEEDQAASMDCIKRFRSKDQKQQTFKCFKC